jgi:hypothetical protein
MLATQEYVERKFEEFNKLCFDGKLKPLPIRLSHARTFLGQLAYKRTRKWFGSCQYTDFVLKISVQTDLPEQELEDTILHEMIHYYILSYQMHDTSAHGEIFVRMMNDLNRKYGRHITVSRRRTAEEMERDVRIRQHLVCEVRFKDGRTGIMIAAHTRLAVLWDAIKRVPEVSYSRWYVSTDPFFNRFPRALTPKVYKISAADLEEHLKGATRLSD